MAGNKQYRKIVSGCPVCGQLCCKFYGYDKSEKQWIKKKIRNKNKEELKNDLLHQ